MNNIYLPYVHLQFVTITTTLVADGDNEGELGSKDKTSREF